MSAPDLPKASDVEKAKRHLRKLQILGRLPERQADLRALIEAGKRYSIRRNRRTGFWMGVATPEGIGMAEQSEGILYYAVCEEHHTLVGTETRAQAESAAASADFCDECRDILWPKKRA